MMACNMKKIAIFGSTGSIGKSTLEVVRHLSSSLQVVALASHKEISLLEQQIKEFNPSYVAVFDEKKASDLQQRCSQKILVGKEGLAELASLEEVDIVVMAISGKEALFPTVQAILKGKTIALASKEVLVAGGPWLTDLARKNKAFIIPIDSEHNALFQALQNEKASQVGRLILTASGGPFCKIPKENLENITVAQALGHPTWNMGPKVTIDSSTLMNKALEMIEASYLFNVPPEKIDVIIHPQSIVHSFVEFIDGTIKAIMNEPNMIYPIQYCLTFPERVSTFFSPFDFTKHSTLEFFPPDNKKFPTINFAYNVLREGKSFPCFLNAANDVLVYRFLHHEISWKGIIDRLEKLLERHVPIAVNSFEDILHIDTEAREEALRI